MHASVQSTPASPAGRRLVAALADLGIAAFSLLAAFALVSPDSPGEGWLSAQFLLVGPLFLLVKFVVFTALHQHERSWRYAGDRDVLAALRAGTVATALLFGVTCGLRWLEPHPVLQSGLAFPNTILIIDWILTNLLTIWSRLGLRAWRHRGPNAAVNSSHAPRKLILGAGDAGETLLRELLRTRAARHRVLGFLDDDPAKRGTRIHGVPVLGPIDDLAAMCRAEDIEEVLIAMPSAPPQRVRRIFDHSRGARWDVRIVPGLTELIEGPITIESQLRPVRLEDLLSREPVRLDHAAVQRCLSERTIMVTGAGGSIGSELCRQITRFGPRRLVLVEQAENNLFEIERELGPLARDCAVAGYLADVGDRRRMRLIFERERPAMVCHAAAHKHVPIVEAHPGEGVKNNVLGTRVVAELALEHQVRRFVMVSTDKAINPTSVMGCTKRVAEMFVQSLDGRGVTRFTTVRFGNVLGSRGSVVPIFQQQIARGGPVTVTDPEASRFFMTIPEAAQLVLQAGAIGNGGDIFVLEMGRAIRIVDLARQLIAMSGRAAEDIDIVFTGLRPGEKLHEELHVDSEPLAPTTHPHIHICQGRPLDAELVAQAVDALAALADCSAAESVQRRLAELVPEYSPHLGPGYPEAVSDAAAAR